MTFEEWYEDHVKYMNTIDFKPWLYEAWMTAKQEAAKVCDKEIKSYMSKQYTTDPLGGYRERFAAEQCAAAIRESK